MRHSLKYLLKHYAFYLGGDQPPVSWVEKLRSVCGALLGLLLVFNTAKLLGEKKVEEKKPTNNFKLNNSANKQKALKKLANPALAELMKNI